MSAHKVAVAVANEFVVEKGIPLPRAGHSFGGRKEKYPWSTMAVGDSFFVAKIKQSHLSSIANGAAKRSGHKFTTRAVTENGVAGIRVWRTA